MSVPKLRFKADSGSEFPEWEEKRLGEVARVKVGERPSVIFDTVTDYEYINAGVGNSGYIDSYNCVGDTVTTPSRGQGGIGFVCYQQYKFWLGPLCYSIKSDKADILTKYLYYFLACHSKSIVDLKQVGTIPAINRDDLLKIRLSVPSLPEQRKIASFLSAIDTQLELSRSELSKWEQFKKGMLQKIFHQEVRFKADDGSVYPEWEEKKLGEVLKEYKEFSPKNNLYIHVSLTKEGVVPKTDRYNRDFLVTQDNKKYRVTHLNDICYNPANLKFGVICRNKYGDGIFSPIYVTFQITKEVLAYFIELIVTNESFIKRVLQYQEGTVYERMAVAVEDFIKMSVSIPSLPEQQKIADLFSSIDQMIELSKQEVEYWESYKKGLLQQMFV